MNQPSLCTIEEGNLIREGKSRRCCLGDRTDSIHPILHIILVKNSKRGKEFYQLCPPGSSDDLCFFSVFILLLCWSQKYVLCKMNEICGRLSRWWILWWRQPLACLPRPRGRFHSARIRSPVSGIPGTRARSTRDVTCPHVHTAHVHTAHVHTAYVPTAHVHTAHMHTVHVHTEHVYNVHFTRARCTRAQFQNRYFFAFCLLETVLFKLWELKKVRTELWWVGVYTEVTVK